MKEREKNSNNKTVKIKAFGKCHWLWMRLGQMNWLRDTADAAGS